MRWPWSAKANRALALDARREVGMVGQLSPRYKDFNSYLQAYKLPWVHAAVSVIAYNCANVAFELIRDDLEEGDDQRIVTSSPFLDLLKRPNPVQSGFAFRETFITQLELTGNAFLTLEEIDGRQQPHEMYLLRPDSVTVRPDPDKLVGGYTYVVNGRPVTYEPDEMLHIKYPNPLSDFYGLGTIEAAESRMDSEQAMSEHERMFWRNGAKITGVLQTDQPVDDSVFARIVANFRRFLTGSGYSTLVLESGLKYQSVSDGPAKLGMLDMAKASRDQILAIFGVPPTKVGIIESANYKALAADSFFWNETIDPKLTRIEQAFQPLLDRFHPGEHLRLEFVRMNFEDDQAQAEIAQLMANTHAYTVDEIRAYSGKEPLPAGGDVILDSSGTPIDLSGSLSTVNEIRKGQGEPELPGGDDMIIVRGRATEVVLNGSGVIDPSLLPAGIPKPAPPPAVLPTKMRTSANRPATAGMIKRHRDAALKQGARHTAALVKFFGGQERRVTAKLDSYKRRKAAINIDVIFDSDDERERLEAVIGPIHMDAAEAGVGTAQVASLDVAFDLENPRLKAYLGQLAGRVTNINDTTKAAIDEMVNAGLAKGYSTRQIASGVEQDGYAGISGVFGEATRYRANMIARTETMAAYNGAAIVAYKESGVVSMVELLDGDDDEECAARNGQIVTLAEAEGIEDHPNGTLAYVPVVDAA